MAEMAFSHCNNSIYFQEIGPKFYSTETTYLYLIFSSISSAGSDITKFTSSSRISGLTKLKRDEMKTIFFLDKTWHFHELKYHMYRFIDVLFFLIDFQMNFDYLH